MPGVAAHSMIIVGRQLRCRAARFARGMGPDKVWQGAGAAAARDQAMAVGCKPTTLSLINNWGDSARPGQLYFITHAMVFYLQQLVFSTLLFMHELFLK